MPPSWIIDVVWIISRIPEKRPCSEKKGSPSSRHNVSPLAAPRLGDRRRCRNIPRSRSIPLSTWGRNTAIPRTGCGGARACSCTWWVFGLFRHSVVCRGSYGMGFQAGLDRGCASMSGQFFLPHFLPRIHTKLLGAPGHTTRSKDARGSWHRY